jgi:hypothetical protein
MFKVLAQTTSKCGNFVFGGCTSVEALINAITNSFFAVVWVVAILFFVYGGLLWITSAGDKVKAETAKTALTNGIIGLVVVLGVNVFVNIIGQLFAGGDSFTKPEIGASIPGFTKSAK